jgi:hypothetical protein
MSTVYLEHSIITHEPSWPSIQAAHGIQCVLSIWNLVEIAFDGDRTRQAKRLTFIDGLRPHWVYDHTYNRRNEVKRFVWRECYGRGHDFSAVTPSLSAMNSIYMGAKSPLALTTAELVNGIDTKMLQSSKLLSKMSLTFLQSISKGDWKAKRQEMFRAVVAEFIPAIGPDGRALLKTQIADTLDLCWQKRDAFYAACPTFAVDDMMCEVRTSTPGRNSSRSDGIDLAHALVALPYCDAFLVHERYLQMCAQYACKRLPATKLATTIKSINELT